MKHFLIPSLCLAAIIPFHSVLAQNPITSQDNTPSASSAFIDQYYFRNLSATHQLVMADIKPYFDSFSLAERKLWVVFLQTHQFTPIQYQQIQSHLRQWVLRIRSIPAASLRQLPPGPMVPNIAAPLNAPSASSPSISKPSTTATSSVPPASTPSNSGHSFWFNFFRRNGML